MTRPTPARTVLAASAALLVTGVVAAAVIDELDAPSAAVVEIDARPDPDDGDDIRFPMNDLTGFDRFLWRLWHRMTVDDEDDDTDDADRWIVSLLLP